MPDIPWLPGMLTRSGLRVDGVTECGRPYHTDRVLVFGSRIDQRTFADDPTPDLTDRATYLLFVDEATRRGVHTFLGPGIGLDSAFMRSARLWASQEMRRRMIAALRGIFLLND